MNAARFLFRPAGPASVLRQRQRLFHSSVAVSAVHHLKTVEEFRSALGQNENVFMDCFAEWCGPCKAISPLFEELSNEAEFKDKVHFAKFDVDKIPELSQELGIRAMPTFLLFQKGEQTHKVVGADFRGLLAALKKC